MTNYCPYKVLAVGHGSDIRFLASALEAAASGNNSRHAYYAPDGKRISRDDVAEADRVFLTGVYNTRNALIQGVLANPFVLNALKADIEVEFISWGACAIFSEHIFYRNGERTVDDCFDMVSLSAEDWTNFFGLDVSDYDITANPMFSREIFDNIIKPKLVANSREMENISYWNFGEHVFWDGLEYPSLTSGPVEFELIRFPEEGVHSK